MPSSNSGRASLGLFRSNILQESMILSPPVSSRLLRRTNWILQLCRSTILRDKQIKIQFCREVNAWILHCFPKINNKNVQFYRYENKGNCEDPWSSTPRNKREKLNRTKRIGKDKLCYINIQSVCSCVCRGVVSCENQHSKFCFSTPQHYVISEIKKRISIYVVII